MLAAGAFASTWGLSSVAAAADPSLKSGTGTAATPSNDVPPWAIILRVSPPLGGWIWSDGFRFTSIWGVSLSVRSPIGIECELGGLMYFTGEASSFAPTPRLGASVQIAGGSSWDLRLPLLGMYSGADLITDGEGGEEHFEFLGVATGLDATFGAFNMRLLPYAGKAWWRRELSGELLEDSSGLAWGVTFEVGGRLLVEERARVEHRRR